MRNNTTTSLLFIVILFSFLFSIIDSVTTSTTSSSFPSFPLSTKGRYVVDSNGERVKFAGVNWYGFDSPDFVAGGLQVNTLENIVSIIKNMGFTAIRIPWSNQLYETNPVVNQTLLAANPSLFGMTALEVLDVFIDHLNSSGILIMLDNHVSDASWCCSEDDDNGLWFNQRYSAEQWLEDWIGMVTRYSSFASVVAVDLRNELRPNCAWHGYNDCLNPTWGGGGKYDWLSAAQEAGNALLKINPNLLIVVEGLSFATDLTGVQSMQVQLDIPNKVVYSSHNYQWSYPFYTCDELQSSNLNPDWGYIFQTEIAPVFMGEFGTCYTPQSCVNSSSPWVDCITWYTWNYDFDWFYWSIDGTESSGASRTWGSPESYGLLDPTWAQPSWPWFLQNKLQTMMQPKST